jgi:mono/diheme cytochrome c family protein
MRVSRGALAVMLVVGLLGVAAACGDDDDAADETTTEATVTTEPTAPATVPPATETAPTETEEVGDVQAGQTFFAATCTSCHLNDGRDAGGVGPRLAGQGLDEQTIRTTVENGRGAMPGGLAQGEDLDNVTAYVLSLQ